MPSRKVCVRQPVRECSLRQPPEHRRCAISLARTPHVARALSDCWPARNRSLKHVLNVCAGGLRPSVKTKSNMLLQRRFNNNQTIKRSVDNRNVQELKGLMASHKMRMLEPFAERRARCLKVCPTSCRKAHTSHPKVCPSKCTGLPQRSSQTCNEVRSKRCPIRIQPDSAPQNWSACPKMPP